MAGHEDSKKSCQTKDSLLACCTGVTVQIMNLELVGSAAAAVAAAAAAATDPPAVIASSPILWHTVGSFGDRLWHNKAAG